MKRMNRFNFDCGLPRSGSTLLSAILDQHPYIHASVASPVCKIMGDVCNTFYDNDSYTLTLANQVGPDNVLQNIIENYYQFVNEPIVVDKNRLWSREIDLITRYIERKPKIICTVREPLDILASFVRLVEKQPRDNFVDRYLISLDAELNTHNRCKALMGSGGMVYDYLQCLNTAFWSGFGDLIMLVEYDDLTCNTEEVLDNVVSFLGAPKYKFDLDNVEPRQKENSDHLISGLHSVRKKVKKIDRSYKDTLPSSIIEEYKDLAFWRSK